MIYTEIEEPCGQEENTHPLMEQIEDHHDQIGNCKGLKNIKLHVTSSVQGTRQ